MPVMMPAPWIASSYMALAASGDSSRNGVPGSISRMHPFARKQLSARRMALARALRPAERRLGALARELLRERPHRGGVGAELVRLRVYA